MAVVTLAVVNGQALGSGQHAEVSQGAQPGLAPSVGQLDALPQLSYRPARGDSIVVFAAHPDDETLGAGGFIHAAVAAGARVTLVTFTNGDGYIQGVHVGFHALFTGPPRFVEYGRLRQEEARAAAARLGIPASRMIFLGYPDRGLAVLWGPRWDCTQPYTSPYTRRDRSPYPLTYRAGSRYCGKDVLEDVEAVLRQEHPTAIVMHHPADTHRDHWAAAAFVTFALERLALQGETWTGNARVLHYLIHHGPWPSPNSYAPDLALSPPADLRMNRARWARYSLGPDDEEAKRGAVLEYRSQVQLLRKYLLSFVRRNELFEVIAPLVPYAVDGDGLSLATPDAWDRIPPAVHLPLFGSWSEAAQGGADLTAVAVARARDRLCLALRLRSAPVREVQYRIELRLLYPDGRMSRLLLHFEPPRFLTAEQQRSGDLGLPRAVAARSAGSRIHVALPTAALGNPLSIYLYVATISPLRTLVDQMPWTLVQLKGGEGVGRAVAPVKSVR